MCAVRIQIEKPTQITDHIEGILHLWVINNLLLRVFLEYLILKGIGGIIQ